MTRGMVADRTPSEAGDDDDGGYNQNDPQLPTGALGLRVFWDVRMARLAHAAAADAWPACSSQGWTGP